MLEYTLLGIMYTLSIVGVYLLTKKKYNVVNYTEVNALLSDILEINFKNNSLSNAAQSILVVLKRFYTIDYVTILILNERNNQLEVIASNAGNDYLSDITTYTNGLLKEIGKVASKTQASENGHLSYPTAQDRLISFSSFTPLGHNGKVIGGVFLENREVGNLVENNKRMKLYDKVFTSTALVLQNVIYTESLISMTSTDQLTGIYNRRFIDMTLGEQLSIHSNLGMSFSVSIMDIDHFKKFNDTYGHAFGDIVLKDVANYIKNALGDNAWVARYGGEEFVLFFGRSDIRDVMKELEKIRKGIQNLVLKDDGIETNVTASFGVTTFPNEALNETYTASDLIKIADSALYKSKENGRNRITRA